MASDPVAQYSSCDIQQAVVAVQPEAHGGLDAAGAAQPAGDEFRVVQRQQQ